jgi:hypothetical protein
LAPMPVICADGEPPVPKFWTNSTPSLARISHKSQVHRGSE